jgi:hypothetical protein
MVKQPKLCAKCGADATVYASNREGKLVAYVRVRKTSVCKFYTTGAAKVCKESAATFDEAVKLWNARHA